VARRDKKVAIYAPAHFKATWRKFLEICERDGVSASHLVRVWVEGYVQRKDPGNPQRPITAWAPGHDDQVSLEAQELYARLYEYVDRRGCDLTYKFIMNNLYDSGVPAVRRPGLADQLAMRLTKDDVRVLR